jgi:hypothetical protein
VQFLQELDPAAEWEAHKALLLAAEAAPPTVPETSEAPERPPRSDPGDIRLPHSVAPARRRLPTH